MTKTTRLFLSRKQTYTGRLYRLSLAALFRQALRAARRAAARGRNARRPESVKNIKKILIKNHIALDNLNF
jgi:hypothetical protein